MKSIWISHPTGNMFVRALLRGVVENGWDFQFFSTLAFTSQRWMNILPRGLRSEISRRTYEVPSSRLNARPWREGLRLGVGRLAPTSRKSCSAFDIDAVYCDLDRAVARRLRSTTALPDTVYAYEDGAEETFEIASDRGVKTVYDLPIAYWESARKILEVEAERWPAWEPTLGATRDSERKLERKTRELDLAQAVICPSRFVYESLPATVRARKECVVVPFGSPDPVSRPVRSEAKLRVLFVGQMSQRKGLADLFAAWNLLQRRDVELVVLGSPLQPMPFYRAECPDFVYEAPRNHQGVLELMSRCDILVLPSLVEGRALVQHEALACGLPLIVTENAGASDLVEDGRTGFLVPIRAPRSIAEKIDWFATNRECLEEMRAHCWQMAAKWTWPDYAQEVIAVIAGRVSEEVSV